MANPFGAIAATAFRLWARDVARLLGVPVSRVAVAIAVAAACAVALGALLASVAASHLPSEFPPELRGAVLGTSFGGAALTAGALGVALCAAAPPRTALDNLVAFVPVRRTTGRLGQLAPTLALGAGFALALSSTATVVVVRTAGHPAEAAFGIALHLGLVLSVLLAATALFSLVESVATRALRLPHAYATAVAGAVALALVVGATIPDIVTPPAPGPEAFAASALLPHRAAAAFAVVASNGIAGLTTAGWLALSVVLTLVAARVHRVGGPPRRLVIPRGTRPPGSTPFRGLVWAELLLVLRAPQSALIALALPLAVVGVALVAETPLAAPLVPSLAGAVVLLPALLGLPAAGRAQPHDWAIDLATARPALRLAPQFAAVALVAGCLAAPALIAFIAIGLLEPSAVGGLVLRGVLAVSLALACGAVVPWSEGQPLSATANGLLLALASAAVAIGVSAATSSVGPGVETPLVVLATGVAVAVYAVARLRPARRADAA